MLTYEQRLGRDFRWALQEGSMHFEKASKVHDTLERICRRLDELGVAYAVVDGLALFYYGYRRFTEDVDLLVSREGLKVIHDNLEGRGYLPPFEGSKQLRDTETGVRVEFLVAGEYPGDGVPKPVAFPDPVGASIVVEGLPLLRLPQLIELRLASGMSNPRRGQDLVDVQKLIEALDLPESLAGDLDPSVRDKFREIWTIVHTNPP